MNWLEKEKYKTEKKGKEKIKQLTPSGSLATILAISAPRWIVSDILTSLNPWVMGGFGFRVTVIVALAYPLLVGLLGS